jgi:hypothetical protein
VPALRVVQTVNALLLQALILQHQERKSTDRDFTFGIADYTLSCAPIITRFNKQFISHSLCNIINMRSVCKGTTPDTREVCPQLAARTIAT